MTPKFKQTRARSEDKKADQFERILEAGKRLFLEKGSQGFSMRNLAEMLGMTKNNLYNYIESKRELWIAIRNKFYNQFKEENLEILKAYGWYYVPPPKSDEEEEEEEKVEFWNPWYWKRNTEDESLTDSKMVCDSIIKLFEHFLDFAKRDYDKFKMMFNVIEAPPSNKIGPIEKKYKEFGLLDGTTKLIQKAIDMGVIKVNQANLLSLLSFSFVMGVAYIEMIRTEAHGGAPSPVWETIQLSKLDVDVSHELLKNYTLKVLEYILKNNSF
jgi:AcrR family transcriptional regulator